MLVAAILDWNLHFLGLDTKTPVLVAQILGWNLHVLGPDTGLKLALDQVVIRTRNKSRLIEKIDPEWRMGAGFSGQ